MNISRLFLRFGLQNKQRVNVSFNIKHKHTGQQRNVLYQWWKDNVLDKFLEENYEISGSPDLVDVYLVNPKNGNKTYITTTDRAFATSQHIAQNSAHILTNTVAEFDKVFRMTKKPPAVIYREGIEPPKEDIIMGNLNRVFISHASKDREVVYLLIEVLEFIGVQSEQIYCSSIPGYGSRLGDDFLERIKTELINEKTFVIFTLSQNFFNSPISMCEMGATWIKSTSHVQILIPPFRFEDIKGVFPHSTAMMINEKLYFNELKELLEKEFGLRPKPLAIWEARRDKLIGQINEVLQETKAAIKEVSLARTVVPYHQIYNGQFSPADFENAINQAKQIVSFQQNGANPSIFHFTKVRDTSKQVYVVNENHYIGRYVTYEVTTEDSYFCNLDCFYESNGRYMEIFTIQ